MENKTKFCGNAKENQYGSLITVSLNQLFKHFYNETKNSEITKIYRNLTDILEKNELSFINSWQGKKEKKQYEIKLKSGKLKNADKYRTHFIALNEWVKENKTEEKTEEKTEDADDIPF